MKYNKRIYVTDIEISSSLDLYLLIYKFELLILSLHCLLPFETYFISISYVSM